jgi:hypothetical protein
MRVLRFLAGFMIAVSFIVLVVAIVNKSENDSLLRRPGRASQPDTFIFGEGGAAKGGSYQDHRSEPTSRVTQILGTAIVGASTGGGLIGTKKRIYFRDASSPALSSFHCATVLDDGSWSVQLNGIEGYTAIRVGGCAIGDQFYVPEESLVTIDRDGKFPIRLRPIPGIAILPYSRLLPSGIEGCRLCLVDNEIEGPSTNSPRSGEGFSQIIGEGYLEARHARRKVVVIADGYCPLELELANSSSCIIEPFLVPASHLYVALVDPLGSATGSRFAVSIRSRARGAVQTTLGLAVGQIAEFNSIEPGKYVVSVFEQDGEIAGNSCVIDLGTILVEPGEPMFVEANFSSPTRGRALLAGRVILPYPGLDIQRIGFVRSRGPIYAKPVDAWFFSYIQPKLNAEGTLATWGPISVPAGELDLRLPGGSSGFLTLSPGESREIVEELGQPQSVRVVCTLNGVGAELIPEKVFYSRAGLGSFEGGGFAGFYELSVDQNGCVIIPAGDVWLSAIVDGRSSEWKRVSVESNCDQVALPLMEIVQIHVLLSGLPNVGSESLGAGENYPQIGSGSFGEMWVLASVPHEVIEEVDV